MAGYIKHCYLVAYVSVCVFGSYAICQGAGHKDWRDEAQRNVNEDVSIPSVHAHGRRSVNGLSWGPLSSNIDGMDAVKGQQQLHMDLD